MTVVARNDDDDDDGDDRNDVNDDNLSPSLMFSLSQLSTGSFTLLWQKRPTLKYKYKYKHNYKHKYKHNWIHTLTSNRRDTHLLHDNNFIAPITIHSVLHLLINTRRRRFDWYNIVVVALDCKWLWKCLLVDYQFTGVKVNMWQLMTSLLSRKTELGFQN